MAPDQASSTNKPAAAVIYRPHRPGDLGMIVHRHGVLYLEEYGWEDPGFEGLVAQIAGDFLCNHDPVRERCWIAERAEDGKFVGSIMLVRDPDVADGAKLRVFLVEPWARGLGAGKTLLRLCIDFAGEKGYGRIRLRTEGRLEVARGLYKREGFRVIGEDKQAFSFEYKSEIWELVL